MKDQCDKEIFYFDRFHEIFEPFSERTFTKDEKPDFLTSDNLTPVIGVELTEIITGRKYRKNSAIQLFSLTEQISKETGRIFTERYKVPLNVNIDFYEDLTISKFEISEIASQLADIVSQYVIGNLQETFQFTIEENLPDSVRDINGSFVKGVTQPVWYNDFGGFVPHLEQLEIENVIKKKEKKIQQYRLRADKVYLLIIEGIIPSWHDKIDEALDHEYKSSFEKVFLYRVQSNSYHQIKTIHP